MVYVLRYVKLFFFALFAEAIILPIQKKVRILHPFFETNSYAKYNVDKQKKVYLSCRRFVKSQEKK